MITKEFMLQAANDMQASALPEAERMTHYKEKYAEFASKYPNLFEMCCKPACNMTMLSYMLDMWEKVHGQQTSQDDASVQVGQRLFDTYVDPILPESKKSKK